MAKFFLNGKWKKRTVTALSLALSLTLSMGILTACGGSQSGDDDDDDDTTAVADTDTQTLKNGNFEFYSEMNTELEDKRALIYSPTSWSFTSGSPSSDTSSGIVNAEEWDYLTKSSYSLIMKDDEGEVLHYDNGNGVKLSEIMDNAMNNWDKASAYDRLEFLDEYSTELSHDDLSKTYEEFFADYNYSIDFEDVENLRDDLGDEIKLHYGDEDEAEGSNVLMIHNYRRTDGVTGTAQSYTSSTTITLAAGTAAELSVWVKTAELYHYYYSSSDDKGTPVTKNAGAYIGVTHTVGGTTLDQMQIKNINTQDVQTNNGWQEYKIYIRANTYATSTFKVVLGLGMGDTSNRYEQVTGYALFDDLTCNVVKAAEFPETIQYSCDLDSLKEDKIFDMTAHPATEFSLDLKANFDSLALGGDNVEVSTTKEYSGSKEYDSADVIPDDRYSDSLTNGNVVGTYTLDELAKMTNNGYLAPILENDFKSYPFDRDENVILLLSTNGAAYTATVENDAFKVPAKNRMLVSFFVKTSEIRSGKTGASAILVDKKAGTETAISPFDSTSVATVDIKDANGDVTVKDIYDGWVQCFFFVQNDADEELEFSLKLTYGPTTVQGLDKSSYCDGYAAFANFETRPLTKTQYSYATTGTYAQTVSLTGKTVTASSFDDNSITTPFEKGGLGTPVNFYGVQSGSINLVPGGHRNPSKDELVPLYTGLLNYEYAGLYDDGDTPWKEALGAIAATNQKTTDFWEAIFGDGSVNGLAASQPLVIMNTGSETLPAYGYLASKKTVSADTYEKISVRVKLSADATAYVYLIDTSENKTVNQLAPVIPGITYWYDDEGNITAGDPSEKDTKVAYYLDEDNGLYTSADTSDKNYYANLSNYDKDEDGNLVTTDGTIAFYAHDGKFYAYRDGKTAEKYVYSQEVLNLPAEGDVVRYAAPESMERYGSCIMVQGSKANEDKWVEVSFYVHTGSEAKSYRLEVWAGSRDCAVDENGAVTNGTGIPAGAYVFFDAYSDSTTTNYDGILSYYVEAKKAELNNGVSTGDQAFLDDEDPFYKNNDEYFGSFYIYYTFTFYDSPDWLRYDVSKDDLDEDGDPLGNPYGSYKQSDYPEKLVWFMYDGSENNLPVYAQFLDYSASNVNVPQDELGNKNESNGSGTDNNDGNGTNIWLVLSSVLLALVIVFAIGAAVVRKVLKSRRKSAPAKAPKQKKEKAPKLKVVKSDDEPAEETPEAPEDENNPYHE